jgi:hypothetical protein
MGLLAPLLLLVTAEQERHLLFLEFQPLTLEAVAALFLLMPLEQQLLAQAVRVVEVMAQGIQQPQVRQVQ